MAALKRAFGVAVGWISCSIQVDVKKVECVIWNVFRRSLFDLGRNLQSDDDVAAIILTMKLIFDCVKARVFSGMMLSIVLENLVAGFECLFGEGAERERGQADRLPSVKEELV